MSKSTFNQRVYAMVKKIPRGKVATYGQIAALIGSPRAAQAVGWALHSLDEKLSKEVPWPRVVNKEGYLSIVNMEHAADEQAFLLQQEGVMVEKKDGIWHIDFEKYLWKPRS
jgi:methylated-DNA-protein-cysteine methyltransferase-like protein